MDQLWVLERCHHRVNYKMKATMVRVWMGRGRVQRALMTLIWFLKDPLMKDPLMKDPLQVRNKATRLNLKSLKMMIMLWVI